MREIKNLKGYRQKPTIYGLNTAGFIFTAAVAIFALLSFLGGITIKKIIIVALVIAVAYFTALLLSSNESINEFLFDEKLPNKFSDDE